MLAFTCSVKWFSHVFSQKFREYSQLETKGARLHTHDQRHRSRLGLAAQRQIQLYWKSFMFPTEKVKCPELLACEWSVAVSRRICTAAVRGKRAYIDTATEAIQGNESLNTHENRELYIPQPWGLFAGNPVSQRHQLFARFLFNTITSYSSLIFSSALFHPMLLSYQIKSKYICGATFIHKMQPTDLGNSKLN